MKNLTGKMALVTGASGGIGLELVRLLYSQGVNLILVSRGQEKLETIKQELTSRPGGSITVISADLSLPGEAERLYQETEKLGLTVDILVNNAGSGLFGKAVELGVSKTLAMLELNMRSLTALSLLFGKAMSERRSGAIINVGSLVALMPVPFFAAYAASKSYVKNFTLALRSELKASGVTVGVLMPGFVHTNFDAAAGVSSADYRKMSESLSQKPAAVAKNALILLKSGGALRTSGVLNRIASIFLYFLPDRLMAALTALSLKNKL